jgi:hypothetical protein
VIFNKVAGFYGLLAILTGLKLNPMQLSMYIYSVAALILIAFLVPHIRKQSPMQCLALAWFYMLDTIINCAYTIAFAITWIATISTKDSDTKGGVPDSAPGRGTIDNIAGFASPKYNISKVDVIIAPASLTDTVAIGTIQHGFELAESIPSLIVIVLLTLVRIYFILITMAYARQVLRLYMHTASSAAAHLHTDGSSDPDEENPFASNKPFGQGWSRRLGRAMVYFGKGYFLDEPVQDDWVKSVNSRFRTPTKAVRPRDTFERERRARSGTGPPPPW